MRMNGMIDLGRATREEAADAHATRPPRGGCPSPFRPRRRRTASSRGGKLYRARSRLYRNEILQVNMRLTALAEIYTMHSFAQL